MKLFQAKIRTKPNYGKTVYLTGEKSDDGTKFKVFWSDIGPEYSPEQSIGYFKPSALFPTGEWRFSDDSQSIIDGKAPEKTFKNGDPFTLIPEHYVRTKTPILIKLNSGVVTPAYPVYGFIHDGDWLFNIPENGQSYNDRYFMIADPYFEPVTDDASSHAQGAVIVSGRVMYRVAAVDGWCPITFAE